MDNPPEHWEIAILGTGLAESILAAALAKAGKKVLHLDENDYYGGDSASLTLAELIKWADDRKNDPEPTASKYLERQKHQFSAVRYNFPGDQESKESLLKESRQYSLSLLPCLVPAIGPTITSLVESGVSRYGGFVLLNAVGMCSPKPGDDTAGWDLKRVPSSKEHVFKDRDMSLIEKRRLMKFLMFAGGNTEPDVALKDMPFVEFLRTQYSLSPSASDAIVYAVAHCSQVNDTTQSAVERMRRYLRSTGRYGNSPFLIGHYGGAGEISQGFCRTAAVNGATYILGRRIESIDYAADVPPTTNESTHSEPQPQGPHYSVRLDGFLNPISADIVISTSPYAGYVSSSDETSSSASGLHLFVVRCIAIIDHPIRFPLDNSTSASETENEGEEERAEIPDTSLVIFPPQAGVGPVSALILGDVSLSCPTGKYIVYLSSIVDAPAIPPDSTDLLRPYLERLLSFTAQAPITPESTLDAVATRPLFTLYYTQRLPSPLSVAQPTKERVFLMQSSPSTVAPLTETADAAVTEAERLFWQIIKPADGSPGVSGEDEPITSFWPLMETFEDDNADDGVGDW